MYVALTALGSLKTRMASSAPSDYPSTPSSSKSVGCGPPYRDNGDTLTYFRQVSKNYYLSREPKLLETAI
jgi:hypothetical protein